MVEETAIKGKPTGLFLKIFAGWLLFFSWSCVLYPWIKYQFWQSDTFWLIETGRLILEKHALPAHDPYSYTSTPAFWVVYQWLTEVLFSLAHYADGLTGVALLGAALLAVLLFVLMFRHLIKHGTNPMIAIIAIAFSAYAYYPDMSSLRPQIISFVLFWLVVAIIADFKAGAPLWRGLVQLFFIGVVWANCHISFPTAQLILGANFTLSLLSYLRKRISWQKPAAFAAMYLTLTLATLFNPYGPALWAFIGNTHNLYFTAEVLPIDWKTQPFQLFFVIVAALAFIYRRKSLDAGDFFAMFGLFMVGNNCVRLIVYFCIFACPIIGAAGSQLLEKWLNQGFLLRLSTALKEQAASKWYVPGVLILTCLVVLLQPTRIPRTIPLLAAKFLAEHPVPGNMFCSAHAGSYLIYFSHGAIPVFMDTRVDLYDAALCKRFVDALTLGKDWRPLFAQYNVASALLPNSDQLRYVMDKQPDWTLIYRDREFSLYIPDKPVNAPGTTK